jgi:hypothetical protein
MGIENREKGHGKVKTTLKRTPFFPYRKKKSCSFMSFLGLAFVNSKYNIELALGDTGFEPVTSTV